ncbi:cell wall-binding repeat-containing protein [Planococcus sp. ISL-109]|uniref:cell wall-binding repeat-containing protein n=1 Tax=Planococcus sp. ISL-109 TaxID=2819166 RepID=UPI001BE9D91C|nr:cell wall-binding repeat-containing protein [Planococcus sp. ISL-109]MBT2581296.1 cell wall-binding repeat-containing protein [Planococcus sp. ISL-109]
MKTKLLFVLLLLLAIGIGSGTASASGKPTVIIDPGHGGTYGGTAGYSGNRTGYYEKHANMEVSNRLKTELEKRGFIVRMTRTKDAQFSRISSSQDLVERMKVANGMIASGNNDNTVFISVHHNATGSPTYGGYETYYFNNNFASSSYPPSTLQRHYSPESGRLATNTHRSVINSGVKEGRGIVASSFYVNRTANVPAVLLEVGYMSNPTEEAMIKQAWFQNKVAANVAKGVDDFFNVYVVNDRNGKSLRHYASKTDALNYAKTVAGSYVAHKKTGAVEGATKPEPIVRPLVYGIYHPSVKVANNLYGTEQEAVNEAEKWKNTRVVHTTTGSVLWSNYLPKKYVVLDGSDKEITRFYREDDAVAHAGKLPQASVIDESTQENDVLWSNFKRKNFIVRSKDKGEMIHLYNREEARDYARSWPNSELFDVWAQKVIFTNTDTTKYSYTPQNVEGKNRTETAVAVSKLLYPNGFASAKPQKTVVLATSGQYADALSAGPLAAHYGNAPILLSSTKTLTPAVEQELKRLKAKNIIMVGGTVALSASVESKLKSMGMTVERLSGKTRYETNEKINAKLPSADGMFVTAGNNYPDALTAASVAVVKKWPIVLVRDGMAVPNRIRTAFGDEVVIIGGTAAVPAAMETAIKREIGADSVRRLSGTTRYDTGTATIEHYSKEFISNRLIVSTGTNYPDALVSSAISARYNAPLFLVPDGAMAATLSTSLSKNSKEKLINRTYYVGGAVNPSIKTTINAMQK